MTAGGKREGAGRKPSEADKAPKTTVSVRLEPVVANAFRTLCKANGKTHEQQLTYWTTLFYSKRRL